MGRDYGNAPPPLKPKTGAFKWALIVAFPDCEEELPPYL
jgi:hypothetical protein